jgi:hypothetical protein
MEMRRGTAGLACLLGALMTLSLCPVAQAVTSPRIINGQPASPGEYPAQGVLRRNGDFICGGTLVSNRYFLTAAHCVTNNANGAEVPTNQFSVTLGNVDRDAGQTFAVSAKVRNADYNFETFENDSTLFTLATPAPPSLEPMRLIAPQETSLWSAGKQSTLIGWGLTVDGDDSSDSQILLETTAPMRSDTDCTEAYDDGAGGSEFHPATMVCAGDGSTDTCNGDSGGPMMVSDGSFLVLAGLTSWGGPCASDSQPGVYTRLGAPALNAWVRSRVPMARATVSDSTPDPGQAVTFSATTAHPGIPAFTHLDWDFDSDGVTDGGGANPTHAYPTAGNYIARVTASGTGEDTAVAKVAVHVAQPPVVTPISTPAPVVPQSPAPPATSPIPRAGLATILSVNRPQVRHGRFKLRINFAQDAPPGIAVIEVFKGKKKIGSARVRVRRGGSRQVSVKLNETGRRLLRKRTSKRLKVKVQVRVKRHVLRFKTLTLRR